jgi:hypothetical protein
LALIEKGSPRMAPGASCTIQVAFVPQSGQTGTVTGTLTLTDNHLNATSSVQIISLTGTGVAPQRTLCQSFIRLPPGESNGSPDGQSLRSLDWNTKRKEVGAPKTEIPSPLLMNDEE